MNIKLKIAHLILFDFLFILLATGCDGDGITRTENSADTRPNSAQLPLDYDFNQNELIATKNVFDLGINGRGMFIMKDDTDYIYLRRPGKFLIDSEGYCVTKYNNTRLQGIQLANIENDTYLGEQDSVILEDVSLNHLIDIKLPPNLTIPPRATTEITIGNNLDSDSRAMGSIHFSPAFLHPARNLDKLQTLRNRNGDNLQIKTNDKLKLSVQDPFSSSDSPLTLIFRVTDSSTLGDLINQIKSFLQSNVSSTIDVSIMSLDNNNPKGTWGALSIYNNSGSGNEIKNFQITSDNPLSTGLVTRAFKLASNIPVGSSKGQYITDMLRGPAEEKDKLLEVYDASGDDLGLENGDLITFQAIIGGQKAGNITQIVYNDGSNESATTMMDLIHAIKDNFRLPDRDGTQKERLSVLIDPGASNNNIPDGSIVIRGKPGIEFGLSGISIRATNENRVNPSPAHFNQNFNFTSIQISRDSKTHDCLGTLIDHKGDEHEMTITFTPTQVENKWLWEITLAGGENLLSGSKGTVMFGADGTLSDFSFNDSVSYFSFQSSKDSTIIHIELNVGGPGNFTGLTQLRSASTAAIKNLNGYKSALLKELEIDMEGNINGIFFNEESAPLYKIPLAVFPSPPGLNKLGTDTFAETVYSGKPRIIQPGLEGVIHSGYLEQEPEG